MGWRLNAYASRFRILLALVIVSMPFHIQVNGFLCGLMGLHLFTLHPRYWRLQLKHQPLLISYLLLFLMYLISLTYSNDLSNGWNELGHKLNFLFMPLVLVISAGTLEKHDRHWPMRLLIYTLVIAAIFCYGHGIYQFLKTGSWVTYWPSGIVKEHHLFYTGLAKPLMHPAYFSLFVGTGLLYLIRSFERGNRSIPDYGIALLFLLFLFMLQARMSLLALFICLSIYGGYRIIKGWNFHKKLMFKVLTIAVSALVLILFLIPDSMKSRFQEFNQLDYDITAESMRDFNGLTIRLAEWEGAWAAIIDAPVFGYGVGDGKDILQDIYAHKGFTLGVKNNFNAHNQFLETALDIGLIGTAILMALLLTGLINTWRKRELLFMLCFLFTGLCLLTESTLERSWGISYFSVILFLLGMRWPDQVKKTG